MRISHNLFHGLQSLASHFDDEGNGVGLQGDSVL